MSRLPVRKIGKYEILEVIGEGGFGVVYKARDLDHDRVVALKVLASEFARSPTFETEILTELRHPHIVTTYDTGRHGTQPYIVTEYLFGRTLAEVIRAEHPMPLERALPILEQLAEALDYVHSRGIIHRDVKPSNIIVEEGEQGKVQVTLTDFGLAKSMETSLTPITSSHDIVGTFAYMAPEQLTGKYLGSATDLYALGIVAYEMLTGHVPFRGEAMEILYASLHEPAPEPKIVCDNFPEIVAQVLLKAISKAPEDRYPTAMAMIEALREAQQGRGPVVAVPKRKIDELIVALRNRDSAVRQVMAEALGKLGDLQAVEPLTTVLHDGDAHVRRAAVEALGKIGDIQAVGPLVTVLGDKNTYVRRAAAKALGEIGNEEAVRPLIIALRDEKVSVRRAAAEALGKIGDPRAVEALVDAQLYESEYVQEATYSAIEPRQMRLDQLIGSLATADKEWRARALSRVALALVQAGVRDRAMEVANQALSTAQAIEDEWARTFALRGVAQAFAHTGEIDLLNRALMALGAKPLEESDLIELGGAAAATARVLSMSGAGDVTSAVHAAYHSSRDLGQMESFAVAQIEDHHTDTPLIVNKEYRLLTGVLSSIPTGFVGTPVQLPDVEVMEIDVVVRAAGMEVSPHWLQTVQFFWGRDSGLVVFKLTPRGTGQKEILLEFYHQRHWLAKLQFDVEVVEARELVPA